MNLKDILQKSGKELCKAGIPTASLDARVLLEEVINKDESEIISHPEMPLTNYQYTKFRSLIRRRKAGEPVAYLTGHKEFYGNDFFVNKNVLIPRPETELIVELTLKFIKNSHCEKAGQSADEAISVDRLPRLSLRSMARNDRKSGLSIIDIGIGSGCIIISLAHEIFKLKIDNCKLKIEYYASDISRKALYIARKNARLHQVDKEIKFFYSDLFANRRMPKKYDVIIANLPYVPSHTKKLKYEPESSIYARDNGTQIIKQFLDQAKNRINHGGLILIELDPRNALELKKYAKNIFAKSKVELIKDLNKLDRIVRVLYN